MDYYNILEEWKKNYYLITSPLSIERHKNINRDSVDFIYETLISFFGTEYFRLKKTKHIRDKNIDLNKNFIYQLLDVTSNNAFYSVLEVAALLSFSKKLNELQYEKLKSFVNDTNSLRNYLFEIFIYRLFTGNNLPINIKPTIKGQELEGTFVFKGRSGLIECKKLYATEINRYAHLQELLNMFIKKWTKLQVKIFAFLIAPSKDEKRLSKEKELMKKWLNEYFDEIKLNQSIDFIFERFNSEGDKILHIEKNKPGLFENMQQTLKVPHAYFSVYPPPVINKGDYNYFRFVNGYYFSVLEEDIQEKILNELKKKRRQHRGLEFFYRIFFFENESTIFGEFPLATQNIIESNLISNYLNSKDSNDVVCLIDKVLFPNQKPKFKMYVYCKPELNELKEELEKLDLKIFHE